MFRGQFKFKNANGTPYTYKKGDVVVDQGKMYSCSRITNKSPMQDKSSWKGTGLTEPYYGVEPPVNPIENQLWLNSAGKMYIWYKDPNGFQWIEI